MLDSDIRVLKQIEDATFTDGQTQRTIKVNFMVGKHGPFQQTFPKDGFTAQLRDDALNTFAREVRIP